VILAEFTGSAPAAICGESSVSKSLGFKPERIGCGKRIDACAEVFRCTDCRVPFHHACAVKHFADSHAPPPDQPYASDEARALDLAPQAGVREGDVERLAALAGHLRAARRAGARQAYDEVLEFMRESIRASRTLAGGFHQQKNPEAAARAQDDILLLSQMLETFVKLRGSYEGS
jgi:hypothetical protein